MCEERDNDPNDPSKGKTKTSDCGSCGCMKSTNKGNHSMYNGKCLHCGRSL